MRLIVLIAVVLIGVGLTKLSSWLGLGKDGPAMIVLTTIGVRR